MKRVYFNEFAAGRKTIEYRRYGRAFTERTFYPGRRVRLAYQYNLQESAVLFADVQRFERMAAGDLPIDLSLVYPDLDPKTVMALIHLQIVKRQGSGC